MSRYLEIVPGHSPSGYVVKTPYDQFVEFTYQRAGLKSDLYTATSLLDLVVQNTDVSGILTSDTAFRDNCLVFLSDLLINFLMQQEGARKFLQERLGIIFYD